MTCPANNRRQVVLCVDSMYWSHDVAAAIVRGTLGATAKRLSTELLQASKGWATA
jgi:hypothetical protein